MLGGETTLSPLARGAFSKAAWREVERTAVIMESNLSFMKRSSLTLLYDARFDVTLKEAFGTTTRSPFTDLDLVRCGISWTRLSARLGRRRGKSILADAFAAELPGAVTGRRGKVPWDGVCARGYALHGGLYCQGDRAC
jgi:hypothetical protein